MPKDPCENQRRALDDARFMLKMQRANPLGWDTCSKEFQDRVAELEAEVAECKRALKECETRSKKG